MNGDGCGFTGAGKGRTVGIVASADHVALRRNAHVGTDGKTAAGIQATVAVDDAVLTHAEAEACNPAAAMDGSAWSDPVAQHTGEIPAPESIRR